MPIIRLHERRSVDIICRDRTEVQDVIACVKRAEDEAIAELYQIIQIVSPSQSTGSGLRDNTP